MGYVTRATFVPQLYELVKSLTTSQRNALKLALLEGDELWYALGLRENTHPPFAKPTIVIYECIQCGKITTEKNMEKQNGFSLLELMVCLLISTVVICMAIPRPDTMNRLIMEKAARQQAWHMYGVISNWQLCLNIQAMEAAAGQTQISCANLQGQMPQPNVPYQIGAYMFVWVPGSGQNFTYTGTPITALPGLRTVQVSQTGNLTCNGQLCYLNFADAVPQVPAPVVPVKNPDIYLYSKGAEHHDVHGVPKRETQPRWPTRYRLPSYQLSLRVQRTGQGKEGTRYAAQPHYTNAI